MCCAAASEVEHRRPKRLGLLLAILTAGLASGAQRRADVGEVTEGDMRLLPNRPVHGRSGCDGFAFRAGGERYAECWWQPECAWSGRANEVHMVGQRVVVDTQPVASGGDRARQLLMPRAKAAITSVTAPSF